MPISTPTTVIIAPAVRHSRKVRRKRLTMSSSRITRSKLSAICDGSGTMKRLILSRRISTSTAPIAAAMAPRPSASGTMRSRAVRAAVMRLLRAACGEHSVGAPSPPFLSSPSPPSSGGEGRGEGVSPRVLCSWKHPSPRPSPRKSGERERKQCAREKRSSVRLAQVGLVVEHAAARLLAQVAPDLRDVAAERLARHDLGRARARQVDFDHALELARTVGHHEDAVGELHRLGDVVGDEQRGLTELLLDLQHLVAEQEPG